LSFGNLKIYPFPAVQYIPLTVTTIQCGPILKNNPRTRQPQLLVGAELIKWQDILKQEYGIELGGINFSSAYPMIALNLEISEAKYRSFYITMTGFKNSGYYQICTMPKQYFYKNNLLFELYDSETAERLAYTSAVLKK
jgi:hypothetical protein